MKVYTNYLDLNLHYDNNILLIKKVLQKMKVFALSNNRIKVLNTFCFFFPIKVSLKLSGSVPNGVVSMGFWCLY